MHIRALMSACLATALVTAVAAPGCATGTSDNNTGDDASLLDDGPACTPPQIACGGSCVDPTTNHDNCGACGTACGPMQVCASSACASMPCMPGQTLCTGVAMTGDAGAGTDGGGDGAADAAAADATNPSEGGAEAGAASYCADLGNDPNNCGTCGNVCPNGHLCVMGMCSLSCPPNTTPCPNSNACAAPGECCTNADCKIQGETCPTPGGTCACPTGKKPCPQSNMCIDSTTCCTSADCPNMGAVCSGPGGTCACPVGDKICPANHACIATSACCTSADCTVMGEICPTPGGMCGCPANEKVCGTACIPNASCCTPADCPPPPHVAMTSCTAGACGIAACAAGWADANGVYSDGCECGVITNGASCGAPTNLGTIALAGSTSANGNVPVSGASDWYVVSFAGNTTTASYHPKVTLSTNPSNEFALDVTTDCAGTLLSCSTEGGNSTHDTTWETVYTNNPPTPQILIPATVYVRVYRVSGSTTCDTYTLTVSN